MPDPSSRPDHRRRRVETLVAAPRPPRPGEVHVWYAFPHAAADPRVAGAYAAVLSAEERERWSRFRFARHRLEYLVAHALLRSALSRYAAVDPGGWEFTAAPSGRPEIAAPAATGLRFSLSHTDGLVTCAVVAETAVGVDAEALARPLDELGLAERFFAPAEALALRAAPPTERRGRFFDYWTLKEAYVKARGVGLRVSFTSFAFHRDERGAIRVAFGPGQPDDPGRWQFALLRPTPRHVLAVAVEQLPPRQLVVRLRHGVPLAPPTAQGRSGQGARGSATPRLA